MSTALTNLSTATDSNESSPPHLATATSFNELSPLNDQPYLHDDLLLNFFVRVSRLYYPNLSLVSKRFRSLLASRSLYKTRKLLNRTESCIYVCLQYGSEEPRWFTLCRRPTRVPNPKPQWFSPCFRPFRKKERRSGENLLISVTTSNFSFCRNFLWSFSTVGSNIYMIGGYIVCNPTSRVFCMDCGSHIWQEAPSMRIARTFPHVSVLDGKIYVLESFRKYDSSNLMEVFDPETQTWEHVPTPGAEIRGEYILKSGAIKGNLYFFGDKNMVYKPKENRWDVVGWEINWIGWAICVVDNVMYSYRMNRVIEWYDDEEHSWKIVKGLEELPKLPSRVTLVNYGGRIVVSWDTDTCFKTMIWCAEITLERRLNQHEIYGKVEWCDVVLTVQKSLLLHNKVILATVL
ncbi:hypothetical protein N665_0336s0023 [Sinapis alba]|nr:hypothetical protein N665_0336s0023 [Sinapis alba]